MVSWLHRIKNNLRIGNCTKKSGLVKISLLTWSKKHWSIKLCFSFSLLSSLLIMLSLLTLVGTIKSYSTNLSCSVLSFWCMPKFCEFTQPRTPMPKFDPHYACTQANHINQASKLLTLFRRLLDPHYACTQANHINQASKLLTLFRRLVLN